MAAEELRFEVDAEALKKEGLVLKRPRGQSKLMTARSF
jgi:hypothetical protein